MIVVICGPPGAGKTTIATRVDRRLESRDEPTRLLHSDDFSSRTYERLSERVAEGPDDVLWLVDGTFYRRRWQERFRTLDEVRFVLVTATLETCLERNRNRRESIDERGVHVIYREFEPPNPDLGIDTDESSVTEATAQVLAALESWRA
ncbi:MULTISPECIES: AAA family ATPase [Natrialbaceae]|uniref:AAA family ATPase n=1 Tax=Natrialbaceae TaxID=1644061 RepID=UPI00207CFE27|nr:AAA family ATPase [Natronococcus sp. CG52]